MSSTSLTVPEIVFVSAYWADAAGANAIATDAAGMPWLVPAGDARLVGLGIAPYEPPPAPVPTEVTRVQARIAMASYILPDGRSLLAATREALTAQQEATAGLPDGDPARIAAVQASEWWTAASVYRRDHPVLVAIGTSLGLSAAQIDALFRSAAAS